MKKPIQPKMKLIEFKKPISCKRYKHVGLFNNFGGVVEDFNENILIEHCKFESLTLVNSIISKVTFKNCSFKLLKLFQLTLVGCEFIDCEIKNFETCRTNLIRCNFEACTFNGDLFMNATYMSSGAFVENSFPPLAQIKKFNLSFNGTIVEHNSFHFEPTLDSLTSILPSHGDVIGWKKAWKPIADKLPEPVIVKLLIPETAQKSCASGRKCRCSEAKVLGIFDIKHKDNKIGREINEDAVSGWNMNFRYVKGETVKPEHPFSTEKMSECDSGIHFFVTLQEALDYKL